jgi:hypothetical protein
MVVGKAAYLVLGVVAGGTAARLHHREHVGGGRHPGKAVVAATNGSDCSERAFPGTAPILTASAVLSTNRRLEGPLFLLAWSPLLSPVAGKIGQFGPGISIVTQLSGSRTDSGKSGKRQADLAHPYDWRSVASGSLAIRK